MSMQIRRRSFLGAMTAAACLGRVPLLLASAPAASWRDMHWRALSHAVFQRPTGTGGIDLATATKIQGRVNRLPFCGAESETIVFDGVRWERGEIVDTLGVSFRQVERWIEYDGGDGVVRIPIYYTAEFNDAFSTILAGWELVGYLYREG